MVGFTISNLEVRSHYFSSSLSYPLFSVQRYSLAQVDFHILLMKMKALIFKNICFVRTSGTRQVCAKYNFQFCICDISFRLKKNPTSNSVQQLKNSFFYFILRGIRACPFSPIFISPSYSSTLEIAIGLVIGLRTQTNHVTRSLITRVVRGRGGSRDIVVYLCPFLPLQ